MDNVTQEHLNMLFKEYPELERCSEIMIPLTAIIMSYSKQNTNEHWFEELESILREGKEEYNKRKIIPSRYLYCEIPIDIDSNDYDKMVRLRIPIKRFWRRKESKT